MRPSARCCWGAASAPDAEQVEGALSLQVVFGQQFRLDADAVGLTLRAFSAETKQGNCKLLEGSSANGTPLGLIGWGQHVVRMVGFDVPMPSYAADLKAQVRSHRAHVLLHCAGREESRLEQYVVEFASEAEMNG